MLPVNPIIAAAAADIVVGFALYSNYAFGPLWTKVTGEKCSGFKDMPVRLAAQIVTSLLSASALYISILTFKKTELPVNYEMYTKVYSWFFNDLNLIQADVMSSMKIAGFIWLGFLVPFIFSCAVWRSSINWQKAILKSLFKLVGMLAMAGAIAYFG